MLAVCYGKKTIRMSFSLALITGASKGLGKALAQSLAKKNIPLWLVSRDRKNLEELSCQLKPLVAVEITLCDLSLEKDLNKLVALVHKKKPDLIINNAGFGLYGDSLFHPTENLLEIVDVNIKALMTLSFESTRCLYFSNKTGTVMNISSLAGFIPMPGAAVYAASKAFVSNFSDALDEELKIYGIRVLTACPGQIRTEFSLRASMGLQKKHNPFAMEAAFLAEKILSQVEKKKKVKIYSFWKGLDLILYYLLPKSWTSKILKGYLKARHPLERVYPLEAFDER
jgi:uncharacterized protein